MPLLKFNEGDQVRISDAAVSALSHSGEAGEILTYIGPVQGKQPGRREEIAIYWDVLLATGSVITVLESDILSTEQP